MPLALDRKDQKEVMGAFRKVLGWEMHNILENPKILWQQMYNRLQWMNGEEKIGLIAQVITPEFKKRIAPGSKPWIHNKCKTKDAQALSLVLEGHTSYITSCIFSPDGQLLATSAYDFTIRLWDVHTGSELAVLEGHTNLINTYAFSPDSKTLVSYGQDSTIRLWDVVTGDQRAVLKSKGCLIKPPYALSPDSKTLVSAANDNTVRLWDVATGRERTILSGHSDRVLSCSFSPNGKILATAGNDQTVRLWDVHKGAEQAVLEGHKDWVNFCAFSPDGKILASAGDDETVRLWNPYARIFKKKAVLKGHCFEIGFCAFSPDGKTLASVGRDKTVWLWNVATGKERAVLDGGTIALDLMEEYSSGPGACKFSPDSKALVSTGGGNSFRLWDVAKGKGRVFINCRTGLIKACAFSPDGQILATASGVMDKTVRLWDVAKGKLIDTYPCLEAVKNCSFSPTDWIIATGDPRGNVYILELYNFDFQQSNNELNADHLKAATKEQTP